MLDKLQAIRDRHTELTALLSDPEVLSDHNVVTKYSKERAGMDDIVVAADEYERILTDINSANEIIAGSTDPDEKEFAKGELEQAKEHYEAFGKNFPGAFVDMAIQRLKAVETRIARAAAPKAPVEPEDPKPEPKPKVEAKPVVDPKPAAAAAVEGAAAAVEGAAAAPVEGGFRRARSPSTRP